MVINFTSIIMVIIFGRILMLDFNFREIGYAYTKLMQEGINFLLFIIILKKKVHKKSILMPSLSSLFKGLFTYLYNSFSSILSFYGEFIAFECNTYYAALLFNIHLFDSWVALVNYSAVFYFTSIGISFAVRNIIGN